MKETPLKSNSQAICFKNIILLVGVFLLSFVHNAYAFDEASFSEEEKVGLAFYKLGNITPDFEHWIRSSKEYQNLQRSRERATYLASEKHRLEQGLMSYYPEFGLITIQTSVDMKGMTDEQLKQEDARIIDIQLNSDSTATGFYFPYPVGKEWVALIPNGMDEFSRIKVTPAVYQQVMKTGQQHKKKGATKKGVIEIIVQPVSVDTSAPLEIDGIYTWLMDGEIASLAIWTENKRSLVWEYTAPWYVSDTQRGIHGLYGK